MAKETNWKQKFQKPQNENIYLTNLNVENNGNFPILRFEVKSEGIWLRIVIFVQDLVNKMK